MPSYGDVWSEENAGKTMIRAHSGLLGAGLHMEAAGLMEPGSVWAAYGDEETMRKVWDRIIAFAGDQEGQPQADLERCGHPEERLAERWRHRRPDLGRSAAGSQGPG